MLFRSRSRIADGTRLICVEPQWGQAIMSCASCASNTSVDWNQPSNVCPRPHVKSNTIIGQHKKDEKRFCPRPLPVMAAPSPERLAARQPPTAAHSANPPIHASPSARRASTPLRWRCQSRRNGGWQRFSTHQSPLSIPAILRKRSAPVKWPASPPGW